MKPKPPIHKRTVVLWAGKGLYAVMASRESRDGWICDLAPLEGQEREYAVPWWKLREIRRPLPEIVLKIREE